MSAPFSFHEMVHLCDNKLGTHDVACPVCGPSREARGTGKRKVLRIFWDARDFATYNCIRCGLKGYARSENGAALDPSTVAKAMADAEARKLREAAYKAGRQQLAKTLWKQRIPAVGTQVEGYLKQTRGIENPFLQALGLLPTNPPRQPNPAMIAPFGFPVEHEPGHLTMNEDDVQGVHLTFLDGIEKARFDPNRKMIGCCKATPIALAPANDGLALAICEGIETALTAHQSWGVGAWAAGSASLMPALAHVVPDHIETILICAEADPAGQRWAEELRKLLIARNNFEIWMV